MRHSTVITYFVECGAQRLTRKHRAVTRHTHTRMSLMLLGCAVCCFGSHQLMAAKLNVRVGAKERQTAKKYPVSVKDQKLKE